MATTIRPEISEKNRYWIGKHRYYELKHFCLQYPEWKKIYISLDGLPTKSPIRQHIKGVGSRLSSTEIYAEARVYYSERMRMIENAAQEASAELGKYLLKAVTEGISYEHLRAQESIPCGKDIFYTAYRRFFWLLDKARK